MAAGHRCSRPEKPSHISFLFEIESICHRKMVLCFRGRGIQLRRVICQEVVTRSGIMCDHVVELVARPLTEISEMVFAADRSCRRKQRSYDSTSLNARHIRSFQRSSLHCCGKDRSGERPILFLSDVVSNSACTGGLAPKPASVAAVAFLHFWISFRRFLSLP